MPVFWRGTSLKERGEIQIYGLTLPSKPAVRPNGDLVAKGGVYARRKIIDAISDAQNAAARDKSFAMLVRIRVPDQSFREIETDVSIADFPLKDPALVVNAFAQVVLLTIKGQENMAVFPQWGEFILNIKEAFGVTDDELLAKRKAMLINLYFMALQKAVTGQLDWEHAVRNALSIYDPASNWLMMNESKNYLYKFPDVLSAKSYSSLVAHQKMLFQLLASDFARNVRTFPAQVPSRPTSKDAAHIDLMVSVDAIVEHRVPRSETRPETYVKKFCMSKYFGPITGDFIDQWQAEIGPAENIIWEDNRH